MFHIRHLAIGYRDKTLATDLTAALPAGRLTVLAGRNGCGKSTLLRTMAALQPPLEGEVQLSGSDFSALSPLDRARRLALVLTDRVDAPGLTVAEVVAMGRMPHSSFLGRLSSADRVAVSRAVRWCGIEPFLQREIGSLSDGERQRVMIARALAQDTPCIFLDEPTAFLDFPAKVETFSLLLRIAREEKKTILLSTHDLEIAFQLAHHLWLLTPSSLAAGTPRRLADDGSIGRAFASESLTFNVSQMRFLSHLSQP